MKKLKLFLVLCIGLLSTNNYGSNSKYRTVQRVVSGTLGIAGIAIAISNSYKLLTDKECRKRADALAAKGNIYQGHFLSVCAAFVGSALLAAAVLDKIPS